jgi:hypothetical protein
MKYFFFLALPFFFIGCAGTLPTVVKFNTRPQYAFSGDTVLLEWVVKGADHVTIDDKPVSDSGNTWIVLDTTRTYILKATATRAEFTKKLTLDVERRK